jgi:hypothetical protein
MREQKEWLAHYEQSFGPAATATDDGGRA